MLKHGAEAQLSLAHGLFRPLALRDVLDDRGRHTNGTLVVANRRNGDTYPHDLAGFVDIPLFKEQVWSIREEEVRNALAVGFHLIGMVQVKRSHLVEKLLARITRDLTESMVHIDEAAIGIDLRGAAGGILKEGSEPLLALAYLLFRLLPRSDVHQRGAEPDLCGRFRRRRFRPAQQDDVQQPPFVKVAFAKQCL